MEKNLEKRMAKTDTDDLVGLLEDEEAHDEIPQTLPLLPVRDVVIFTHMILPLFVTRDKSVRAVDAAMNKDRYLFLATQMDASQEDPPHDKIYKVGAVGRVLRVLKLPDGRVKILVQAITKARILSFVSKRSLFRVKIEKMVEEAFAESLELTALMRNVQEQCEKILSMRGELSDEVVTILKSIEHPGRLADLVASNLNLKIEEAQSVFELSDPVARLNRVNELLIREVELSSMQARIQENVRDEISKSQKDYFLREQMRAIKGELGEGDERAQEADDYVKRIKKAKMPREAEAEALKQLKRLEQMHPESAEAPVVRSYLDWLVEIPWSVSTKDAIDIKKAQKQLDEDHFGLEKIKERILEYLAVRKLNPSMKGPILCFVGPPGVGKTSLGQSIAKAMNRKFYRMRSEERRVGKECRSRWSPYH